MSDALPGWAAAEPAVAHVFLPALDDRCVVAGPDGHHLRRVRRIRVGEHLTAADGEGAWRGYDVAGVEDGALELCATGELRREPVLAARVGLALSLTKAGLDAVAARATELGVARITPLRAERCVVRWDAAKADAAVARLRTIVREASAQSRRASIPAVEPVIDVTALSARTDVVVADPSGRAANAIGLPVSGEWTVAIGPEGGFAPTELELLASAPRLALGPHVLRAETAPLAAVALLIARA